MTDARCAAVPLKQRWQDNHQQGLAALVLAQQQLALLAQAGAPANKATLDQLHRMVSAESSDESSLLDLIKPLSATAGRERAGWYRPLN